MCVCVRMIVASYAILRLGDWVGDVGRMSVAAARLKGMCAAPRCEHTFGSEP